MPPKWDDGLEKRLLLEVIATINLTVERSTWNSIAAAMGGGLTGEACRQKFQGIKRNLKALYGDATLNANGTSTPKAAKVTKPRTPASASATATSTKGRKRKAADAALSEADDDDNDEPTVFTPQAPKAKKEKPANRNVGEVFKAEEDGERIDLERDDLYDDAV